jgi:hypothetical protein
MRVRAARPPPCINHHVKSCSVYSIGEGGYTPSFSPLLLYVICGADTLPLFLLYPYVYLTPAALTKKDADKNF